MFTKTLIAAAVAVPAFALASTGFAGPTYQGGPKSSIAIGAPNQTVETKKPYAEYVPTKRSGTNAHIYQGGPNSPVPHRR